MQGIWYSLLHFRLLWLVPHFQFQFQVAPAALLPPLLGVIPHFQVVPAAPHIRLLVVVPHIQVVLVFQAPDPLQGTPGTSMVLSYICHRCTFCVLWRRIHIPLGLFLFLRHPRRHSTPFSAPQPPAAHPQHLLRSQGPHNHHICTPPPSPAPSWSGQSSSRVIPLHRHTAWGSYLP